MNLQEDRGISHQQFPVIDMLLFSCDLFFLPFQVLRGKINRHMTLITVFGYHIGGLTNTFHVEFERGLNLLKTPMTGYYLLVLTLLF